MIEIINQFIFTYLNSQNVFLITASILGGLLILYVVLSLVGFRSIKKIIKALREEIGEEIIKRIEGLSLSKRYEKMWQDYYEAYCSETTVSLHNYLIKNDILGGKNIFKVASRVIAIGGFSFCLIGVIKNPVLFEAERQNLICLFFALLTVEAVCELVYLFFEELRRKRTLRFMEEFEMLSKRKLHGFGVNFETSHLMQKISELDERIDQVRLGVNQLNARLDRQYRFLENREKPEEC